MKKTAYRFGWHRDLPDQRDQHYYAAPRTLLKLPTSVDLRPHCSPVYDQGQLGACTAHALAGAFQYLLKKQKRRLFMPSRLFIYYNPSTAATKSHHVRSGQAFVAV